MILNVSGRTDVVAFYSKWFMKRINAGFVDVRNPFNPKLVSRINFNDVDLIMLCTKNPIPILKDLPKNSVKRVTNITRDELIAAKNAVGENGAVVKTITTDTEPP